jgi:hypothetical protein
MHTSRKKPQHAGSIFRITWFTENGLLHDHDRIRTQHHILRPCSPDRQRLLARQQLRTLARHRAGQLTLIDIGLLHDERNPHQAQKFLAARRCGSEHKHARCNSEV